MATIDNLYSETIIKAVKHGLHNERLCIQYYVYIYSVVSGAFQQNYIFAFGVQ